MDPSRPVWDAQSLRRMFDAPTEPTIGLEEEVMLLAPVTLDLLPRATEVIRIAECDAIGSELPASQIELRTRPHLTAEAAVAELMSLRERVTAAAVGIGRLAAAGAHPFAEAEGVLNSNGRYDVLHCEYGPIARKQLICALHVHVALRPADRAVAVHNALRAYLPELAALAANCPFHNGVDSGLASARLMVAKSLPRQGIPPILTDMDELARWYGWCVEAGLIDDPRSWWWESRLNPHFGTVEVRVPDSQTTVGEAGQIAAVVHALCLWLAQLYDRGELPDPVAAWKIEQNRWRACRFGLDARLADLWHGRATPARERWAVLLEQLIPVGEGLGGAELIRAAGRRIEQPTTATRHRQLVRSSGIDALAWHLAEQFLVPVKD